MSRLHVKGIPYLLSQVLVVSLFSFIGPYRLDTQTQVHHRHVLRAPHRQGHMLFRSSSFDNSWDAVSHFISPSKQFFASFDHVVGAPYGICRSSADTIIRTFKSFQTHLQPSFRYYTVCSRRMIILFVYI